MQTDQYNPSSCIKKKAKMFQKVILGNFSKAKKETKKKVI